MCQYSWKILLSKILLYMHCGIVYTVEGGKVNTSQLVPTIQDQWTTYIQFSVRASCMASWRDKTISGLKVMGGLTSSGISSSRGSPLGTRFLWCLICEMIYFAPNSLSWPSAKALMVFALDNLASTPWIAESSRSLLPRWPDLSLSVGVTISSALLMGRAASIVALWTGVVDLAYLTGPDVSVSFLDVSAHLN